jgi:hypothetical protein
MESLKKLTLTFGFLCCFPWLSTAGEFLRNPNDTLVKHVGDHSTLTVSIDTDASKQLFPVVKWDSGDKITSRSKSRSFSSMHLKPKAWFVFYENPSRIWMFDGEETLDVLLMSEKLWTTAAGPEDLKPCPKEVRSALPETVRKKYFHN